MKDIWSPFLDCHPFPSLLLDTAGHIVAANHLGRLQLSDASSLVREGVSGRLDVLDPQAYSKLSSIISAAPSAGVGTAPHLIAVADVGQAPALWLQVWEAPSAAPSAPQAAPTTAGGTPSGPSPAGPTPATTNPAPPCTDTLFSVSIRCMSRLDTFDPHIAVSALGLTLTEAQLAVALARGQSIKDFATATGRELTTVRWHRANAMRKTGSPTQLDLVRLVILVSL